MPASKRGQPDHRWGQLETGREWQGTEG